MTTGNPAMDNYNQETRFALMEQSIQHMTQSVQRLETSLESRFNKIDDRFDKIDARFEKVDHEIKEVHKELKGEIRSNFFWTLGVIGTVFGIVAHGLHWF